MMLRGTMQDDAACNPRRVESIPHVQHVQAMKLHPPSVRPSGYLVIINHTS